VRHDIPVTAVVFHNRQWGAEKKNQVDFYNRRFVAGELDNQSFAGIAKAMGAEASSSTGSRTWARRSSAPSTCR
jgi:sulfoacetaldehyde acetyltransferase